MSRAVRSINSQHLLLKRGIVAREAEKAPTKVKIRTVHIYNQHCSRLFKEAIQITRNLPSLRWLVEFLIQVNVALDSAKLKIRRALNIFCNSCIAA
jgi:hypothetical protein